MVHHHEDDKEIRVVQFLAFLVAVGLTTNMSIVKALGTQKLHTCLTRSLWSRRTTSFSWTKTNVLSRYEQLWNIDRRRVPGLRSGVVFPSGGYSFILWQSKTETHRRLIAQNRRKNILSPFPNRLLVVVESERAALRLLSPRHRCACIAVRCPRPWRRLPLCSAMSHCLRVRNM